MLLVLSIPHRSLDAFALQLYFNLSRSGENRKERGEKGLEAYLEDASQLEPVRGGHSRCRGEPHRTLGSRKLDIEPAGHPMHHPRALTREG